MLTGEAEAAESARTGSGVAAALTRRLRSQPPDLQSRLLGRRALACTIRNRSVVIRFGMEFEGLDALAVPFRVGKDAGILHLSPPLLHWLLEPLGIAGTLADEEALARALLLEFAIIDLIRPLEMRLDQDIRFGECISSRPAFTVDLDVLDDGRAFGCRLQMPLALAELLADGLDQLQPSHPPDPSQITTEVVIEAGAQDLTANELAGLRPGDIVMLDPCRPSAMVEGLLAAPVVRRANGVLLVAPFAAIASRAALPDTVEEQRLLRVAFEIGRIGMTLAEIDRLSPGDMLSVAPQDGVGVDLVVSNRRAGRGELVSLGEGTGVRIVRVDFPGIRPAEAHDD